MKKMLIIRLFLLIALLLLLIFYFFSNYRFENGNFYLVGSKKVNNIEIVDVNEINSINFDVINVDIEIVESDQTSNEIIIETQISESYKIKVMQNGDQLVIQQENSKKIFGFDFSSSDIKVTVPKDGVESLNITSVSGNVSATKISMLDWKINTVSGDVVLYGEDKSNIKVDTVSGDLEVILCDECGYSLEFDTISGEMEGPKEEQREKVVNIKYESISGDLEIE